MKKIRLPLDDKDIRLLKAGEIVLLSGVLFTARDAAHKRMLKSSEFRVPSSELKIDDLPFDIKNQTIYYAGPTPPSKGRVIGSCGPTTSSRMDEYTPILLKSGLRGMIGKGKRSKEIINTIKKHNAVYFIAIGGAGAFYSKRIKKAKVVAYKDLGPEGIYKLEVENFPVIVGIDSFGNSIYKKTTTKARNLESTK